MVLIDLAQDVLAAAAVNVSARGMTVNRVALASRPNEVEADAPDQVGQWVRHSLDDAGISTRRAVFAVPRAEVVLKVLELPTAGIESEAELCQAVRLQMTRQLTMPIDESIIDSVTLPARGDDRMTCVLAGAIHRDRVEWYRQVARAAGLKIAGVRLRSGGIARLAGGADGPVLAIASGAETTDFVVAEHGRVLFARSVELQHATPELSLPLLRDEGGGDQEQDLLQRVAVEAKRTWMSYRVSQRAEDVRSIVVMGRGETAQQLCERCQAMLELEAHCVELPASLRIKPSLSDETLGTFLPLLGLGVRLEDGSKGLDFLNPRRPPDVGARRRQLALAGMFALVVLGGAGYLFGQNVIGQLEAELSVKQTRERELFEEYVAYLKERARSEHVQRWDAIDADYIGHLAWLTGRLPDPKISLADRVDMTLVGEVRYEGRSFPEGRWSSVSRLAVDVSGKVSDRSIALELRERLLETGLFTVVNRGPDVADRYDFELTTQYLSPDDAIRETDSVDAGATASEEETTP